MFEQAFDLPQIIEARIGRDQRRIVAARAKTGRADRKLDVAQAGGPDVSNRLGRSQMGKLFVYSGPDHPHAAQQPVAYDTSAIRRG